MEEENFFLSLDYDGRYRRLRCRGGAFDVELMLPKNGCALSTANPFRRRRQFYCGFRRIFPELRGRVTLNGQDYPLGERSFAVAALVLSLLILIAACALVFFFGDAFVRWAENLLKDVPTQA